MESIPTDQKDTVDKIYHLLKNHFEGNSWRWNVKTKLLSRRQLPTETLDDYACDIMHLCKTSKQLKGKQLTYNILKRKRNLPPFKPVNINNNTACSKCVNLFVDNSVLTVRQNGHA